MVAERQLVDSQGVGYWTTLGLWVVNADGSGLRKLMTGHVGLVSTGDTEAQRAAVQSSWVRAVEGPSRAPARPRLLIACGLDASRRALATPGRTPTQLLPPRQDVEDLRSNRIPAPCGYAPATPPLLRPVPAEVVVLLDATRPRHTVVVRKESAPEVSKEADPGSRPLASVRRSKEQRRGYHPSDEEDGQNVRGREDDSDQCRSLDCLSCQVRSGHVGRIRATFMNGPRLIQGFGGTSTRAGTTRNDARAERDAVSSPGVRRE